MSGNLYYGWHDDSRAPVEQKIADAIAAYVRRFERQPNLVLVNAAEVVEVPGVDVRATSYIRPGNFWVGWEELAQPTPPPPAQRVPVTHDLKCHPEYFGAVRAGCKSFELRRDDRGFTVGDLLLLREWNPAAEQYTGERVTVEIGYILRGFPGIEPGYAILSLKEVRHA